MAPSHIYVTMGEGVFSVHGSLTLELQNHRSRKSGQSGHVEVRRTARHELNEHYSEATADAKPRLPVSVG